MNNCRRAEENRSVGLCRPDLNNNNNNNNNNVGAAAAAFGDAVDDEDVGNCNK